jgi:acetyl/propionyl-CoA carboxylase alpha subunit
MGAIRKLLIANRGEIALRIIRSARLLGIKTVAVYSEADANAAHVTAADEALPIGPPEPVNSYLDSGRMIAAATASGADAVHPGYGFLSEQSQFARALEASQLTFVGPPAEVLASLGDKVAARHIALESGVPVVSGSDVADVMAGRRFAEKVGYPILIKAAAGGGGRGMRVVENAGELEAGLDGAAREAEAAFGNPRLFLEKYLSRPRHIEVQILADQRGKTVALGERECSIQRRHQKIVEESPAPGLSDGLRNRIVEAAVTLARAAGYRNAGTVEFLVDGDAFYFLEVNARLQVEHPITEIRFGRDLVADQLLIAMGEQVAEPQTPRGAAIECRINAEDPAMDFRPATGPVIKLVLPAGPGVRVDTHLLPGMEVSPYYDSLLAKVICFGDGREQARLRMSFALGEFSLLGVRTTAQFLRDVVASESFARAELSTRFVPEFLARSAAGTGLLSSSDNHHELKAALIAAALAGGRSPAVSRGGQAPTASTGRRSPWDELVAFELWRR